MRYKDLTPLLSEEFWQDAVPRFEAGALLVPGWRPDNLATPYPICFRHFFLSRILFIFCIRENAVDERCEQFVVFQFVASCFAVLGSHIHCPDPDLGFFSESRFPDHD
jgi:hypothetical protein